ncbi:ABC transporter permease [Azospirillum sp. ST 5-10]|uniref:ABC transporter permease n=1 Tax=unclassified Azospirillum TaxID=2630922 RepID=UPI003F4A44F1
MTDLSHTAVHTDRRLAPGAPEEVRSGGGLLAGTRNVLYVVLPLCVLLLGWEVVARVSQVPAALLPPVSDILAALAHMAATGQLWADLAGTLGRLFKSVFVGIAVGTVIGTLMGYFKLWERVLSAPVNFLLAIPGTALFPLSMIWFGLSELAITSILMYEVALTVVLNTWTGVKSVDASLIRAGKAFGAGGVSLFWRVLIPAALPSIMAGYRLAFSRCWRILIVAEMLVSVTSGLGYRIYWGREFFHSEAVYAGLLVVGLVGLLIERVLLRTIEVVTIERWGTVRELS